MLIQFAMESIALSVAGGLVGLVLEFGGALAVAQGGWAARGHPALGGAPGGGISKTVGLVFGAYPSWRAACLVPIAALRRK